MNTSHGLICAVSSAQLHVGSVVVSQSHVLICAMPGAQLHVGSVVVSPIERLSA